MASNEGLLKKAFTSEADLTREDVFDILFYAKEVFGAILGVIIALIGVMGLPGIIAFALAISLLTYLYVFKFLGVD